MSSPKEMNDTEECCPPFDSSKYQDGNKAYKIKWKNKPFVVDGTRCLFHIPLAFGKAVTRAMKKIEQSEAQVPKEDFMILSECSSPWWSDVLVSTSKECVEGAEVKMISGSFLAKAFEGDYSNIGKWVKEMNELVLEVGGSALEGKKEQEKAVEEDGECSSNTEKTKKKKDDTIYFYYPTCPKCAKKHGRNYVVIFAMISS
jgi:hypothetical protein